MTDTTQRGWFGAFGGMFVPEILVPVLEELDEAFQSAVQDPAFIAELDDLLKNYAGRPTPLYRCRNFAKNVTGEIYVKREDLVHGGAHKTNQVLAQGLLAKRMGKTHLIAETGAGQHGVASAMIAALLDMPIKIYMGAKDVARQAPNVFRMRMMGAEVIPVTSGSASLKDSVSEALRDWSASYPTTHYLMGTAAGAHPFPTLVRDFQKVIGEETRAQIQEATGGLPDVVMACVGGGSNAIGMFHEFVPYPQVRLVGVEPAGHGLHTAMHGATLQKGTPGVLHGAVTQVLHDDDGQIQESHSLSAGLDYPGVGPEHAHLQAIGRATYVGVTDEEAVRALVLFARCEGIIPALESAHALAYALKYAQSTPEREVIVVNLSGRGDKDMAHINQYLQQNPALAAHLGCDLVTEDLS